MSDQSDIPTLTDLIDADSEIKISDLGLDEDLETGTAGSYIEDIEITAPSPGRTEPELGVADPFKNNPALEQSVRRILDKHVKLAWQEIKIAIQRELKKR